MIKCKSEQVYNERYVYSLDTTVQLFLPIHARPMEVVIVHKLSVYNASANSITALYKVMQVDGELYRWNYVAALATKRVQRWAVDMYLVNHQKAGIEVVGGANGDLIEVCVEGLRLKDSEY